jgi:hypothetical protein
MRQLSSAEADRQETPLRLGQPVRCNDGRIGSLTDVVIDPTERRVSHIVVEAPNGAARLVPADLVELGPAPGQAVFLSCSIEDVLQRATIRSFSYAGVEEFPLDDDRSDVGVEDVQIVPGFGTAGLGDFGADRWTSYAVTYDRIPPGSAELRRGSIAVSTDGDEIGAVDGFRVAGDRLTHVVLQHRRPNGAGPDAIPIDFVAAIETDRVTLALPEVPEPAGARTIDPT